MLDAYKAWKLEPRLIPQTHQNKTNDKEKKIAVNKGLSLMQCLKEEMKLRGVSFILRSHYVVFNLKVKTSAFKDFKWKLRLGRLLNWIMRCVTFALKSAVTFGSRNRTEASWLCPEQQHINIFLFFAFQLAFTLSLGKYKPKTQTMQQPFFQLEKVVLIWTAL